MLYDKLSLVLGFSLLQETFSANQGNICLHSRARFTSVLYFSTLPKSMCEWLLHHTLEISNVTFAHSNSVLSVVSAPLLTIGYEAHSLNHGSRKVFNFFIVDQTVIQKS